MEKVVKVSDAKGKLCIKVKGRELALFNIKGKFYCIDNLCTHASGPLCEGKLKGFNVVCPWHDSEFDVRDGKVKAQPARENIKNYKITVKENYVWVDI